MIWITKCAKQIYELGIMFVLIFMITVMQKDFIFVSFIFFS